MVDALRPAPSARRERRESWVFIRFLHIPVFVATAASPTRGARINMLRPPWQCGKWKQVVEECRVELLRRRAGGEGYFPPRFASMVSQIFAATSGPLSR